MPDLNAPHGKEQTMMPLRHALFRRSYGCSSMIIGRDHAGVADHFGLFEETVEIKRHGAATGEVKHE